MLEFATGVVIGCLLGITMMALLISAGGDDE